MRYCSTWPRLFRTSFGLLAFLLLLLARPALATHGQAGQITYEALGSNRYRVTVAFFRDCSGRTIPSTLSLVSRQGCSGTSISTTLSPTGQSTVGNPYCAGTPGAGTCGTVPGAPSNYETLTYQGIVTLPPAAEWVLSVTIDARPYTATLVNSNQQNLRMEATLNSLITLPGGRTQAIDNNSPQFSNTNSPVPFVCVQQQSTLSFAATDFDRLNGGRADSLVYSIEQPLNNCNSRSAYVTYPGTPCVGGNVPGTPGCAVQCATIPATYTAALPILVKLDTISNCPTRRVVPSFYFNAQAGSFTFTPARFVPVAQATNEQMENKYVVVGMVTEYRKINGVYYKVGSVRRDFLVIVIDCGNNRVPAAPLTAVPDSLTHAVLVNRRDTTRITVETCTYARIQVRFTDPNSQDILTVALPTDLNALLQGGDIGTFRLRGNGTTAPAGTFVLQPPPAAAGSQILINVRIEDNACPVKGVQYRTIVVNVVPQRSHARVAADVGGRRPVVCAGTSLTLTGSPSRPDSVLQGTRAVAQTYRYQWRAAATGGLDAAQATSRSIRVTPTATTRYFLQITGSTVPTAGCNPQDTTSIVVRVVPPVRAAFRLDSASASGTALRLLPPVTYTFTNTSAASGQPGPDSTRWTMQRVRDAQGNATTEPETVFSRQYTPAPVVLLREGYYVFRLYTAAGGGTSCPTAQAARTVFVPGVRAPNVITPNGDQLNDRFVVSGEQVGGRLQIYNRWGRLVQQYDSYQNQWDAASQSAGTYFYYLVDLQGQSSKGWIDVVK